MREARRAGWGGAGVEAIAQVVPPEHPAEFPPVEVLCDVNNPLCGERGAAAVYGPQKGATPDMVRRLDEALCRLAKLIKVQTGRDIVDVPGAGAAGGMAAGAMAFLGARLVPGVEAVMEVCRVDEALRGADWVITGEGRFDLQSLQGKVVSGIIQAAQRNRVKVAVIAGQVALTEAEWRGAGVGQVQCLVPPGPVTPALLNEAGPRLADRIRALALAD